MKKTALFVFLTLLLFSCKKDDPIAEPTGMDNNYVNSWIFENMSTYYLWTDYLPSNNSKLMSPTDYFKSLKYKDDRFSAIFEDYQTIANELNGVSNAEVGFDFQLSLLNDNISVIGIITYVKKGTPAALQGLKRGQVFYKINNTTITNSNYISLINDMMGSSTTVNLAMADIINNTVTPSTTKTITKLSGYQENPLYLDTVYTINSSKIGYLVYHFFTGDAGDNSLKYDLGLNAAFSRFNQKGINELVLDLRYNRGGAITSAVNLASMIVPNLSAGKLMSQIEYNSFITSYFSSSEFKAQYPNDDPFKDYFSTTIKSTTINNVGNRLNRLFVLTGPSTASASEMVINNLKPYINVVLVGDTTIGKNVGSILINDDAEPKNKWAILPIILKYYNSSHQSDFTNGFIPDFLVNDDIFHELGDINEGQLSKAIQQITGITTRSAILRNNLPSFKSRSDFKKLKGGILIQNQYKLN